MEIKKINSISNINVNMNINPNNSNNQNNNQKKKKKKQQNHFDEYVDDMDLDETEKPKINVRI